MSRNPGALLWAPTAEDIDAAPLASFTAWLRSRHGLRFDGYADLWSWSTESIEQFWGAIREYHGVGSGDASVVLPERVMPGADWFPGIRLNYAEEVLRRAPRDAPALIFGHEDGAMVALSRDDLRSAVGALAATLARCGVGRGDRVAAFLPNVAEAVIGLLATASLGAIWTSCSPDFGTQSVIERFKQVEPKALLATGGYRFGGQVHDRREIVEVLRAQLPTLRLTVVVPGPGEHDVPDGAVSWSAATAEPAPLAFEPMAFGDPLWVLFSSGTTGTPKGIVQGHGGIVLEHLKGLGLGSGIGPGDRLFFFSSTSWMVWNWLVGALLVGATPVLYDGSPGYPDVLGSWRVAARAKATVFGTGAAYLTASEKAGAEPARELDLTSLRTVVATGSPLPTSTWHWVHDQLGPAVRLDSSSGGTDVCGGLIGGSPWLPVRANALAAACLGVKAQAFDARGEPVVGALGELVIREPMPSMPIRFFADPDGSRYREAYFDAWPGVWRHGDWVEFAADGSAVLNGRSDATLNRAGVRMGSGDIYAIVDLVPGVRDSLVLGLELPDGGYFMPLFVVLDDDAALPDVADRIRAAIRSDLSRRHLPDEIHVAPAIPRTKTGKRLEVPIKRLLQGTSTELPSADAVVGGEALEWFVRFGRDHVLPQINATREG